jgi:hypothetical protein
LLAFTDELLLVFVGLRFGPNPWKLLRFMPGKPVKGLELAMGEFA